MRGDAPEDLKMRRQRAKSLRALTRAPGAAPTKRHRFGALLLVIKSWILRGLGMREASSAALDRAQDADPSWPAPGLLQGNLWLTAGNLSRAVAGYRRALASFSDALASNASAMTRIARTYLERTDELLAEGRTEAARALIDELMLSNLSRVTSHVRHAARRRRRKLARALPPAKASE
jgi:tetratricopeptide (TPR) repeat protein